MTKLKNFLSSLADCISSFWRIATTNHYIYEYVVEDIELEQREDGIGSIIYYRAIGSRNAEYSSASELNEAGIFAKFMPVQAQAIVTLATIEKMMSMNNAELTASYRGYMSQCAKLFRSQRRK